MELLALLSEAPGGRGGIAQYNRDLLMALADCGGGTSIRVLPRAGGVRTSELPAGVLMLPPLGKTRFVIAALWAVTSRRFDVVFCGHINLAPLAAMLACLLRAP